MGTGGIVMMRQTCILLAAASLIGTAAPAFAQQAPPGGQSGGMTGIDHPSGRDELSEGKREEIRKKIEAVRMWKLTEELKLDENTAAKLSAYLSSIDQQRRDMMREQFETMRVLKQTLQTSKPAEPKLRAALDKLEKNRHAMMEIRDKEIAGLKSILTTEQQARFLIFQQEFRHDIQRMIAGARGGHGRGGMGPGPGRGQGPGAHDPGQPPDN